MRNLVGFGLVVAVLGLLLLGGAGLVMAQSQDGPPHENPDEIDDDSNPEELERWFGGRMGEIHVDCSEGLAVGNFDACQDLDEEYESYLERYVDVERETTSNESERQAEEFNETRNEQREFAERLQEFNETRQEYEEARESGDDTETRARAREMRRQANRVETLGGNISSGFRELDDSSSADLEQAAVQTEETTAGVVEIASQAQEESLEPVEFGVNSDDEASFAEPATVSGLVRTSDWSAVSGGTVVVRDDAGFQANATVDEDGRWSVSYRPAQTETGETTLQAWFVPEAASPYMNANGTTPVEVIETPTTVQVENATEQSAYGENVTAVGTLTAAGAPASNVTVELRASNVSIETVRTDGDGRFAVTGPLPATVPAGDVSLAVLGGQAGTALAPSDESRMMAVDRTETSISAQVDYDDGRAHLSGQLQTVDGESVRGQTVTIRMNGDAQAVTTDANGAYSFTFDQPSSQQEATVSYDSSGGNLDGSQTSVAIDSRTNDNFVGFGNFSEAFGAPDFGTGLWLLFLSHPVLISFLGGLFILNVVFWLFVAWRRLVRGSDDEKTIDEDGDEGSSGRGATGTTGGDIGQGLATARDQLGAAPATAVQLAFATVRRALGKDDARTHWEVYQAASDDIGGERRDSLRTVTETFEAATFSPEGVDSERAGEAVDDAERCLSETDTDESSSDRP